MPRSITEIQQQVEESIIIKRQLVEDQADTILQISEQLINTLQVGGTIYLCGNGGSAADAQHIAAEFVGRYLRERRALPAVALTTDTSCLTALVNDYDVTRMFARQVEAFVKPQDTVVGISTSGKSPNVIHALEAAQTLGATTIGFTGTPGEPLRLKTDLCLCIPSGHTPRIQEAQILAWHIICDFVEQAFDDES